MTDIKDVLLCGVIKAKCDGICVVAIKNVIANPFRLDRDRLALRDFRNIASLVDKISFSVGIGDVDRNISSISPYQQVFKSL